MGPHTPLLLPPLPALANCHPTPGKGDSREAPMGTWPWVSPRSEGSQRTENLGYRHPTGLPGSWECAESGVERLSQPPAPSPFSNPNPASGLFRPPQGIAKRILAWVQPKAPQILYTFCKTPNTPLIVRRERPKSSPECGASVPTFSVPLLSGAISSGQGRSGLLPLLVGGAPGPSPHPRPYPGASQSGSTPCSLLEHRGRVAGLQLHVSTWAECQGAGPGLGMGPAGEIRRQQGWEQGKGQGSTGRWRGWRGVPWVACSPRHGT